MDTMHQESRGTDENQQSNHLHLHHHLETSPTSLEVLTPSASSSSSQEFSFTISLNPISIYYPKETSEPNRTKPLSSSFLDLSPADEIFFHGQLLPLHNIPHLPSSISTSSSPNFTLPERTNDGFPSEEKTHNQRKQNNPFEHHQETRPKASTKQKSCTFFGLQKWRKGCEEKDDERQYWTKRKLKLDNVNHVLKRCLRMVRPFLSFRITSRRDTKMDQFGRESHSFSGLKKQNRGMGAMGYSSAPASIRTSPTNSGHLSASTATINSSPSESTMEELQTAIQAAIAHCKNSIAMEDDNKKGQKLE